MDKPQTFHAKAVSAARHILAFLLCLCICLSSLGFVSHSEAWAASEEGSAEYVDFITRAYADFCLALRADGTIIIEDAEDLSSSLDIEPELLEEIGTWTDIVKIALGRRHIIALKSDGTVLSCGDNSYGQCDVEDWKNIKDIAAGSNQSFGLTSSGKVLCIGGFNSPIMASDETATWRNVEQFIVGHGGYDDCSIIALCSDGTVVGMGEAWEKYGWEGPLKDAVWVYTDGWISGCITESGTARIWGVNSGLPSKDIPKEEASADKFYEQVTGWEDLKQLYFMELAAVALRNDGQLCYVAPDGGEMPEILRELSTWNKIEKLFYDKGILIGLRQDGRLEILSRNIFADPGEEDEFHEHLTDTLSGWRNVTDIKICDDAVIAHTKDGSSLYFAPKFEELLEPSQSDSSDIINNVIISVKNDSFADMACTSFSEYSSYSEKGGAALIAWRQDGSVYTYGVDEHMGPDIAKEVESWTDIVSAGFWLDDISFRSAIYGIKKDGSVEFAGHWPHDDEPFGFSKSWKNVAQIANYGDALVLLKDGRVHDIYGNFLEGWENIAYVYACACPQARAFLGLSEDGKLYSATSDMGFEHGMDLDDEYYALIENPDNDNIVSFDTDAFFIAAVEKDGSVVTSHRGLTDTVGKWKNISQVCVQGWSCGYILGLTEDGKIKCASVDEDDLKQYSELEGWKDIATLYHGDFGYGSGDIVIGIDSTGSLKIMESGNTLDPMLEWKNVKKLVGDEESGFYAGLTEEGELLIHHVETGKK